MQACLRRRLPDGCLDQPTGDASVATHVFKAPVAMTGATRDYDVTDGRFCINVTNPAALNPVATPISVDLNWTVTLHKK
jgi:hypothetical protein